MPNISFDESFSLNNKVALVTGAASGIGLEIARMFARKGADIAAFDMADTAELGAYVKDQGRKFWAYQGDITLSQDINNAVQGALDFYDRIDILINCVGVGLVDYAENLSEEIWDTTMNINLKGTFLMSQAVGRSMIKNGGGRIISIASQAGITAMEKHLAYGVSKAGIIYMTKLLGYEWAKYNIRCNAISPTIILTPLGERVWNNPEGDKMKSRIPINRFGMPNEVAASALFLASDAADLITGENLVIDGGFSIYQGV
jgi:NAD(P)-dependent dehydrogenase (short-subunit alcohol dehydrogenase family)